MATKDHGSSIKDDEQYERLREEGESKEKAARIANTPRSTAGKRGGTSEQYEDWDVEELAFQRDQSHALHQPDRHGSAPCLHHRLLLPS